MREEQSEFEWQEREDRENNQTGGGTHGISRRRALAAIGVGALAAAAGSMWMPGKTAYAAITSVVLTTIAELRSGATAADATKLYVVTDSGREGDFIYDAGDTTTADDDGIVFVSVSGKRFKRIAADVLNVKWFGAAGDNTADDSAAVQAAIDLAIARGGGTVYLPSGKYVVTNLIVNASYVTIRGDGLSSTWLVNRHATNYMLDIRMPTATTITNIAIEDLMIKNETNRNGDYPLVYAKLLVGSRIHNVFFQNTNGAGYYFGSGVRIEDGFELSIAGCTFRQFQKGYALDMPNTGVNVGNVQLSDCSFMYCGHSLLYARGGGSMANTVLLSNVKFVAWQGGGYVANGRVRYYQTKATSAVATPGSDLVPVPDASKFTSNECVLVGSGARVTPARIIAVDTVNQRIQLDRTVTIDLNDTVLQGTVAVHAGWRCQELKINAGHFEGCDVGLYASNKLGLLTLDSMHVGSTSNMVVVDDDVKYLHVLNSRIFYNDPNTLYTNWWTVVRVTKLSEHNQLILLDSNYIEGSGSADLVNRKVINETAYKPLIRIFDRAGGMLYKANTGVGITYEDGFTTSYKRTDTSQTSRQRWLEGSTEKWALEFKDTAGHLGFKLNGQTKDSLLLDGSGGHVGSGGSAWNEPHLRLGDYHLWVDASGGTKYLRIKNGAPTGASDGTSIVALP